MAKREILTTGPGEARWCWVTRANTRFKPEGEYKVTLDLPNSEESTSELIKLFDDSFKEAVKQHQAQQSPGKNKKTLQYGNPPYIVDPEDNEGFTRFNFKQKAQITKADGSVVEPRIVIFDSKGKDITGKVEVYPGSILRVGFFFRSVALPIGVVYLIPTLTSVQVIKLADSPTFNPFGEYDGGFTNDSEDNEDTTTESNSDNSEEIPAF
jgi:hypothetical protein